MAELPRYRSQTTVVPSTGGGSERYRSAYGHHNALIQGLREYVGRRRNELDQTLVAEAEKQAAADYYNKDFQEQEDNSPIRRAYNRIGEELLIGETVVDLQGRLNQLSSNPEINNKPVEIQKVGMRVAEAVLEPLPDHIKGRFVPKVKTLVGELSANAQKLAAEQLVAQQEGSFTAMELIVLDQISNAAENGNVQLLTQFQDEYLSSLNRNGPLHMGGTGVLSPADVALRREEMFRRSTEQLVLGEFRRGGASLSFIHQFQRSSSAELPITPEQYRELSILSAKTNPTPEEIRRREELQVIAEANAISAEDKQKITDRMLTEVGQRRSIAAAGRAAAREARELNQDMAERAFYLDTSWETYQQVLEQGDPGKIATYKSYFEGQQYGDNPEVKDDFDRRLYNGSLTRDEIDRAVALGSISGKTANDYRKDLAAPDKKFTSTEDYKEAYRRLGTVFPVERDLLGRILGGSSKGNDEKLRYAETLLYDAYDSYYGVPPEQRDPTLKPDMRQVVRLVTDSVKKAFPDDAEKKNNATSALPTRYRGPNGSQVLNKELEQGLINQSDFVKYSKLWQEAQ